MDDAGMPTAHIVGNSLGGRLALQLAPRGRARSVVAFAPAGGWASHDTSHLHTLRLQAALHAEAVTTTNFEHIPPSFSSTRWSGSHAATAQGR